MGIYLGQLPPAEFARLKAELAETLVANFCYPRFFDWRTNSLRMRPVDRAKRQEVWLYLSSFDFTAWSRLDLMSPEFQNQVERLFIQFVQRNRSFFGIQGRKRMNDVRTLIGSSSATVVQGLRSHLTTNPKQSKSTFGSPRPVVSWAAQAAPGKAEPSWEEISAATMLLQQQLQEARGEVKSTTPAEHKSSANGATRRATRSQSGNISGELSHDEIPYTPTIATPVPQTNGRSLSSATSVPGSRSSAALNPAASFETVMPVRQSGPLSTQAEELAKGRQAVSPKVPVSSAVDPLVSTRKSEPLQAPINATAIPTMKPAPAVVSPISTSSSAMAKATPSPSRNIAQTTTTATSPEISTGQQRMLSIGDDDIAIFEQLRHQLLVWMRVEAIRAGLEINGQNPVQLLDLLRQQARMDETRLQVVSSLLNLANQVIKTGLVSILDYKQALMFHLMHTRN